MKKILFLMIALCSFSLFSQNVEASTGKISVSSSSTVVVGNTLTVTVTLSSSTALGAWEFDINYDSSYLRLTSSTAENNGTYFVNYGNGSMKSKTYTLKFKALKSGSTNITVGSYDVYDWNEDSMSITKSNKKVTLMTQEELEATYSKNNNLKDISVTVGEEKYELDPSFDSDTLEYNVTVPTGTTLVSVLATKSDATASVDGDGEIEVTEGLNTIPIVVTAQNGDEKTYTLVINVEDQNPIHVSVDGKNYTVVKSLTLLSAPASFTNTTIQIEGFDIPAFVIVAIGFSLVGFKDQSGNVLLYRYLDGEYSLYNEFHSKSYILVPVDFSEELDYIKTTVDINGITMDAYKYTEDSNLVIINALNLETGSENLYLYDSKDGSAILFDDSFIKDANQTIKYYSYVILAFGGAIFLMLILIFILLHSTKKKQKKINQFIEKQEAKLEATRKLNDVVSVVKKITEEDTKEEAIEEIKPLEVTFDEEKESNKENVSSENSEEGLKEENKKSKKELKQEQKEAKRLAKEEKKIAKQEKKKSKKDFFEEEIDDVDARIEDEIKNIDNIVEEDTGVYDIFEDDRKKKKKKK